MGNVKPDFEKLIEKARKTNAERDQLERQAGFLAASDDSPVGIVRTAMMAIEAGIKCDTYDDIAEAWVLLEDAVRKLGGSK